MSRGRAPRRLLLLLASFALGASIACGGDLESRLAEIRTLQESGKFEESIEPLRGLVTTNSSNPEVNFRLGLALVQTGRASLAIWPLNKAAESEAYALNAGVLLATTLLQTEDFAEAVRAANRVLEIDPDNKPALYSRAQGNISAAKPDEALADAEHLLELDPKDVRALALKTGALVDLGRLEDAESLQHTLRGMAEEQDDPKLAAGSCAALVMFYSKNDREDEALKIQRDCLERFPDNAEVRAHASQYYVAVGLIDDAAALWRAAVEETPEDPSLRIRLADLLLMKGDLAGASAVMTEMVELFDTAEAWRAMSAFRRSSGEHALAREALEQSIERMPSVSEGMQFELADLLVAEGNLERARTIAGELKEPAYAQLLNGSIALTEGKPQEALGLFEQGMRRWPNNAGARYLAGLAAEALGDRARARAEFREAVRNDEKRTDAALRLAQIHFEEAEFAGALEFANRQIQSRPFIGPEAHIISARAAIAEGKLDVAEKTLADLANRPGQAVTAEIELAAIVAKRDGEPAAVAALTKARAASPEAAESLDLLRALVDHQIAAGRPSDALASVVAARKQSDSAALRDLEGRVLLRERRIAEAKAAFEAALASDASLASAHEGLGNIALASGSYADARTHFDRAAELDPKDGEHRYRGAQATLALGDRDDAIARLRSAVEVSPSHAGACNDLAFLLAESGGDLDLALELAARAVRVAPGPVTSDTLGWVHLKRGEANTAVNVFQRVIEKNGESPARLYHLGLALAQQGETAEAIATLRRAVANDGGFADAAAVTAEISRLEKLL